MFIKYFVIVNEIFEQKPTSSTVDWIKTNLTKIKPKPEFIVISHDIRHKYLNEIQGIFVMLFKMSEEFFLCHFSFESFFILSNVKRNAILILSNKLNRCTVATSSQNYWS